jgi:hypothetical protein
MARGGSSLEGKQADYPEFIVLFVFQFHLCIDQDVFDTIEHEASFGLDAIKTLDVRQSIRQAMDQIPSGVDSEADGGTLQEVGQAFIETVDQQSSSLFHGSRLFERGQSLWQTFGQRQVGIERFEKRA